MQVKNRVSSGPRLREDRAGGWAAGLVAMAALVLSGCSTQNMPWLPSAGPSAAQIDPARKEVPEAPRIEGIQVVELNDGIARRLLSARKQELFSDAFPARPATGYVVGAGDVLEVSVWEAPRPCCLAAAQPNCVPARPPPG